MEHAKVLVVGSGSAALHHTQSLLACGAQVHIAARRHPTEASSIFRSRFENRYGIKVQGPIFFEELSSIKHQAFDAAIIATPPLAHQECLETVSQSGTSDIFIEKPFWIDMDGLNKFNPSLQRVYCASNLTFRKSFGVFIATVAEYSQQNIVKGVLAAFQESVEAILSAHKWVSRENKPWFFDPGRGGGVATELCHALFFWQEIRRLGLTSPQERADQTPRALKIERFDETTLSFRMQWNRDASVEIHQGYDERREISCAVDFEDKKVQWRYGVKSEKGLEMDIVNSTGKRFVEIWEPRSHSFREIHRIVLGLTSSEQRSSLHHTNGVAVDQIIRRVLDSKDRL